MANIRWEQGIARVLTFVTVALACVYILFWLILAVQRISYPYQLEYGEGPLLHQALTLAQGGQIYTDFTTPPYMIANFPPVFVGLWAPFARFAGAVFWPGRLIAVASTLSIALCIYCIIRHFTSDRWAGLLGIGCFLWLGPARSWTALARPDMLAVALAIGGLAVIIIARPRSRWVAVPLFVLAFLTKQTMVAAPAAAYLYLWLKGERKFAGKLFLVHVLATGLIFALLEWWTNGNFWVNVVTANQNEWLWSIAQSYLRRAVLAWPVLLALALTGTIVWLGEWRLRGVALYFLTSVLVAMTIGKVGSWWNYAIEATAAGMILVGLVWAAAQPNIRFPVGSARTLIACLMLFQLAAVWIRPPLRLDPAGTNRAADARLEQIVASEPGEVLSENMGVLVRTGKRITVSDAALTTQMQRVGTWDQSGLLKMLRNKFFSLVILSCLPTQPGPDWIDVRWTKEEIQTMRENYRFGQKVGDWYLLRPKGTPLE